MKINKLVSAATNTFSLPAVCIKLRQVLDDPKSGLDEFGDVVSTDPILSAKLLKLANSALFRFSQQIETVTKAVTMLGGEATYNLAMANAAGCATQSFESSLLEIDQYWYDCLFRGAIAKEIAKHNKIRGSERFFVLGVLSDLSEMVMASHFPQQYKVYKQKLKSALPWQAQQQVFGFTFSQASSEICSVWGLPSTIFHPLALTFNRQEGAEQQDVKILELGIKLAFCHSQKAHQPLDIGSFMALDLWHDDEYALDDMLNYCAKETRRIQSFF